MLRSEEYTQYILDRRLGCRQLGMNLPTQVTAKRISEHYDIRGEYGFVIWTPYFERDYIHGIATDKVPSCRFEMETSRCNSPPAWSSRCSERHCRKV